MLTQLRELRLDRRGLERPRPGAELLLRLSQLQQLARLDAPLHGTSYKTLSLRSWVGDTLAGPTSRAMCLVAETHSVEEPLPVHQPCEAPPLVWQHCTAVQCSMWVVCTSLLKSQLKRTWIDL